MAESRHTPLLVLTNLPDQEQAEKLAQSIIGQQLAACVNILAPCTSIYRWQGQTETAHEIPVLIKTTAQAYAGVENLIREQHPYELPEIVQVPITGGLPAYIQWLIRETRT